MNTLGSWIDMDAAAEAARAVAVQPLGVEEFAPLEEAAPPRPLHADDFNAPDAPAQEAGPVDAETARVRELLEDVKRRAEHSGLLKGGAAGASRPPILKRSTPAAPAAPVAAADATPADQDAVLGRRGIPYFTPPMGPLGTRLRAFADWIRREVPFEQFFIVDGQGCPVSDNEPAPDVLAAALVLSDAARRASRHVPFAAESALHLDLEAGRKLSVIHTETAYGHFCLGLVAPSPLSTNSADRLRRALKRTVESETPRPGPVRVERW